VVIKENINVCVAINLNKVGNYTSIVRFGKKSIHSLQVAVNAELDLGAVSRKEGNSNHDLNF
jgi:hypothetical protein